MEAKTEKQSYWKWLPIIIIINFIILLGLTAIIQSKIKEVETTSLTRGGQVIENMEELPSDIQDLMQQYIQIGEREINTLRMAEGMLVMVQLMFVAQFIIYLFKDRKRKREDF